MAVFWASFLGTFCGFLAIGVAIGLLARRPKGPRERVCAFCDYKCFDKDDMMRHVEACEHHPMMKMKQALDAITKESTP